MVVQGHVTHDRLLQVFTTGEPMGFEHIGNAPIEALDHAIGSGRAWLGQAMFNVQGLAQLIKLMVARGLALTTGKQPVGELLAVVGQDFLHLDRTSLVQGVQKRASSSGRLVALDLNEHPARGAVNSNKQIAPAGLVRHLGQVFDIDVDEPRRVAFEGFVGLRRLFGLEVVEVANAVAAKTPIKARACSLRAKKLAGDGQQVVQGQQQHLSEFDHDLFLCGGQRGLQSLRGVGRVMKAVSALPFVDGAFTHAVTQRQSCSSFRTGRHLRAGGGRGACVFMQGNHHDKAPGLTAEVTQTLSINWRMTSLAMNSGYRFESMQSSGMRHLRMHRYAAILAIYSYLESSLNKLCNEFKIEKNITLSVSELNGDGIARCRKYLNQLVGIDFTKINHQWSKLADLNRIRNCIIHVDGNAEMIRSSESFIKMIESSKNLGFAEGKLIMVSREFIYQSIDNVESLLIYIAEHDT